MPRRAAGDDDWELYKDEIISLFESKSLEEVRKHEFESHLRKWKVTKNVHKCQWDHIIPRVQERKKRGKASVVSIHNKRISADRVRRECARREKQMTPFERFGPNTKLQAIPKTPPGVIIRTPSPMSPLVMGHADHEKFHSSGKIGMNHSHASFTMSSNLPWLRLNHLLDIHLRLPKKRDIGQPIFTKPYRQSQKLLQSEGHVDTVQHVTKSIAKIFPDEIMNMEMAYLPHIEATTMDDFGAEKGQGSLTFKNLYLTTLKTLCGIVSNNLDPLTARRLVELAQKDSHVQDTLREVFSIRQPSIEAMADMILLPAIEARNGPLVQILLDRGVDIDMWRSAHTSSKTSPIEQGTALLCAVYTEDEKLIRIILDRKPKNWSGRFSIEGTPEVSDISVVAHAVELGNQVILDMLLKYEVENAQLRPRTALLALQLAFLRGRNDLAYSIMDSFPHLLKIAKTQFPAILLEAAAVPAGVATFDTLLQLGITPSPQHDRIYGGVLAVAILSSNIALAERLLKCLPKEQLQGPILTTRMPRLPRLSRKEDVIGRFQGLTPLHAAIFCRQAGVVRELLERGVHPNEEVSHLHQPIFYPLQLAAWVGDIDIAELLIQHRAALDATVYDAKYIEAVGLNPRETPLEIAISCRNASMVQLLHRHGARTAQLFDASYPNCRWLPLDAAMSKKCINFEIQPYGQVVVQTPVEQLCDKRMFCQLFEYGIIDENTIQSNLVPCIMRYGAQFMSSFLQTSFYTDISFSNPGVIDACVFDGDHNWMSRILYPCLRARLSAHPHDICSFLSTLSIAVLHRDINTVKLLLELGIDPYQELSTDWTYRFQLSDLDAIFLDQSMEFRSCFHLAYCLAMRETVVRDISHFAPRPSVFQTFHSFLHSDPPYLRVLQLFLEVNGLEDVRKRDQKVSQLTSAHLNATCLTSTRLAELFKGFGLDLHTYENKNGILGLGLQYTMAHWIRLQALPSRPEDSAKKDRILRKVSEQIARLLELCAEIDPPAFTLYEWPSDFSTENPPWHSPLQSATALNNLDLVEELIDRGANVNSAPAPHNGATALQFASISGNFKILNLLMSAGADINANRAAYQGRTALEGAAEAGRLDITVYLLENGANIEGKTNCVYRRAVYRAWTRGFGALVQVIQTWKKERFGEQDCDEITSIISSMSHLELEHEPGCMHKCLSNDCDVDEDMSVISSFSEEEDNESMSTWFEEDDIDSLEKEQGEETKGKLLKEGFLGTELVGTVDSCDWSAASTYHPYRATSPTEPKANEEPAQVSRYLATQTDSVRDPNAMLLDEDVPDAVLIEEGFIPSDFRSLIPFYML